MSRKGTEDREFLINPLIYSEKLAYLQLINPVIILKSKFFLGIL